MLTANLKERNATRDVLNLKFFIPDQECYIGRFEFRTWNCFFKIQGEGKVVFMDWGGRAVFVGWGGRVFV